MRQALCDEPMTIFGDGDQTRAFTFVGDVIPTLIGCLDVGAAWGQVINLGTDEVTQVLGLARLVAEEAGVPYRVRRVPPRRKARSTTVGHSKAKSRFGFSAPTPLRAGLHTTAVWARHSPAATCNHPPLELPDGIPPVWRD